MNLKKILVLLSVSLVIICIISPANAKLDSTIEVESSKTINGKTKLILYVSSDIGVKKKNTNSSTYSNSANSISKRNTELNSVNKIIVTVNGYKSVNFKKPAKGWNVDNLYFTKTFSIKGDQKKISDNECSIKLYNKKNKLLKNKKAKVLFAQWQAGTGISGDPKKYFDSMRKKHGKKKYFDYEPFNRLDTYSYPYTLLGNPTKEFIINTSSNVDYYDRNSKFKAISTREYAYWSSYIWYPAKKMEKPKNYTNGKYKLSIETFNYGKRGIYKKLSLFKSVFETRYTTMNNPYFANSKECTWTNPTIMNLAQSIKANVNIYDYYDYDQYNTELANEVMRYIVTNIKYDDSVKDQTALSVLKRGTGNCVGNSHLAGALLRALGIPTYFEESWPEPHPSKKRPHAWIVAYIFYENRYQWVPAETTQYFTGIYDYTYHIDYQTPFRHESLNWWIIDKGGKFDHRKFYFAHR